MSMMIAAMNYTHAILLLLSNPVLGWVTWHGSTQRDDLSNFATVATPHQPFDPDQNKIPENHTASPAGGTIDILRLLNLSARTPGVAQVPGPILNVPAFKLRPGFGLVQVPNPSAVTSALSSSAGFTLVFVYRQHRKSLGTLLSVHAPGRVTPYFQVASNLRTGQLVLHYRLSTDAKLHQNAWSLRPAAQYVNSAHPNSISAEPVRRPGGLGWTFVHLSLNTSTNMLRLQLDCQPAREQLVAGSGGRGGARAVPGFLVPHMHVPDDALVYFRQEPGFKKKFLGSMQVAKVYPYATTQHSDWTCDGYRLVRQTQ